nr:hypothetical protein PsAHV6-040 [Psittacid alphaherpesvirus 6]
MRRKLCMFAKSYLGHGESGRVSAFRQVQVLDPTYDSRRLIGRVCLSTLVLCWRRNSHTVSTQRRSSISLRPFSTETIWRFHRCIISHRG